MITKKDIILDYKASTSGKRALKIDFLKGISKSNVYISKKTGLVFHKPKISTDKVLKFWSEKIFSNKIDYKNLTYSSENITMKSRHFYCANFSKKYLIKKNLNYCDFGTGEGNFLKEVLSINKNININFTEFSKKNILLILKDLKSKKLRNYNFHNGPIEHVNMNKNIKNINFGSLLWTLCNCIDPIEVLKSIHKKMSKSSHLLIAESSRILVPFKKPIYNYFNIYNHTENTHPWHFSFNSLSLCCQSCASLEGAKFKSPVLPFPPLYTGWFLRIAVFSFISLSFDVGVFCHRFSMLLRFSLKKSNRLIPIGLISGELDVGVVEAGGVTAFLDVDVRGGVTVRVGVAASSSKEENSGLEG